MPLQPVAPSSAQKQPATPQKNPFIVVDADEQSTPVCTVDDLRLFSSGDSNISASKVASNTCKMLTPSKGLLDDSDAVSQSAVKRMKHENFLLQSKQEESKILHEKYVAATERKLKTATDRVASLEKDRHFLLSIEEDLKNQMEAMKASFEKTENCLAKERDFYRKQMDEMANVHASTVETLKSHIKMFQQNAANTFEREENVMEAQKTSIIESLKSKNQHLCEEIERLRTERELLHADSSSSVFHAASLSINGIEDKLKESQLTVAVLKEEIKLFKGKLENCTANNAVLKEKLEFCEKRSSQKNESSQCESASNSCNHHAELSLNVHLKEDLLAVNSRLKSLEDVHANTLVRLAEFEDENERLHQENGSLNAQITALTECKRTLTLEIDTNSFQIATLKKETQILREQLETFSKLPGVSDTSAKILSTQSIEKGNIHEIEIERLKSKIASLESTNTNQVYVLKLKDTRNLNTKESTSLKPSSESESCSLACNKNTSALLETKEMLEKRLDRMRQVFKEKIKEFREIVFTLIGYQIDMMSDGSVKLLSLYSFDKNDYFIFKREKDGALAMQQTPFVEAFKRELEVYVQMGNSFPAFLAAITANLWEKSTVAFKAK